MSTSDRSEDDSGGSAANAWLRASREQLLEDLAVKSRDLQSCETQKQKTKGPWWVRTLLWAATIVLLVIAVWGIVALVYGHKLSNGVAAARQELAALNAKIARRLQLLDDTQRVVRSLSAVGQNGQNANAVSLRLAQLQQVLDSYSGDNPQTQQQMQGRQQQRQQQAQMQHQQGEERGVLVPVWRQPHYQPPSPMYQPQQYQNPPLQQQQQVIPGQETGTPVMV